MNELSRTMTEEQFIDYVLSENGNNHQIYKAVEEMSELAVEFMHSMDMKLDRSHLVEEFADVVLMLKQMKKVFHITDEEIYQNIHYKIQRYLDREDEKNAKNA